MKLWTDFSYAESTCSTETEEVARYTQEEIVQLYHLAVGFCGSILTPFKCMYRCKPKCYWDDIHTRKGGVMEVYLKDPSGHEQSPINGRLHGLFFSAEIEADGTLPTSSSFGDVRFIIKPQILLDPTLHNIYFCDFYCIRAGHYVTLVVCQKGSQKDKFCEENLKPLYPNKNHFLHIIFNQKKQIYEFFVNLNTHVEVFYTENISLNLGMFDTVEATGTGSSKLEGLAYNKSCTTCNLNNVKKPIITLEQVEESETADDDILSSISTNELLSNISTNDEEEEEHETPLNHEILGVDSQENHVNYIDEDDESLEYDNDDIDSDNNDARSTTWALISVISSNEDKEEEEIEVEKPSNTITAIEMTMEADHLSDISSDVEEEDVSNIEEDDEDLEYDNDGMESDNCDARSTTWSLISAISSCEDIGEERSMSITTAIEIPVEPNQLGFNVPIIKTGEEDMGEEDHQMSITTAVETLVEPSQSGEPEIKTEVTECYEQVRFEENVVIEMPFNSPSSSNDPVSSNEDNRFIKQSLGTPPNIEEAQIITKPPSNDVGKNESSIEKLNETSEVILDPNEPSTSYELETKPVIQQNCIREIIVSEEKGKNNLSQTNETSQNDEFIDRDEKEELLKILVNWRPIEQEKQHQNENQDNSTSAQIFPDVLLDEYCSKRKWEAPEFTCLFKENKGFLWKATLNNIEYQQEMPTTFFNDGKALLCKTILLKLMDSRNGSTQRH
uniref:Phytanoyl-CoA hydroxylase-interacting protein-like C-terminal domain-containing protein n=2 Tax=Acrobeloides nanus TaxID=290746 RepID=A0A914CS78_9BILA